MKREESFVCTANMLNTLTGGVSEPQISLIKQHNAYMVHVKVPGVPADSLKIDVVDNMLVISQQLEHPATEQKCAETYPRIVFNKVIPFFVEVENITAVYDHNRLEICLPFNERANGYHRKIEIDRL